MTQFKLENHNAVALLNRLRIATRSTQARERRSIYNGLLDALKGLAMIESKQKVEGIWEGIDHLGNHWFMVEQSEPAAGVPPGVRVVPSRALPGDDQETRDELHNLIDSEVGHEPPQVITAQVLRNWAASPAASGYVPVHPETLRRIAEFMDRTQVSHETRG